MVQKIIINFLFVKLLCLNGTQTARNLSDAITTRFHSEVNKIRNIRNIMIIPCNNTFKAGNYSSVSYYSKWILCSVAVPKTLVNLSCNILIRLVCYNVIFKKQHIRQPCALMCAHLVDQCGSTDRLRQHACRII